LCVCLEGGYPATAGEESEARVENIWALEPLPLPEDDGSNDSLEFSTIGQ
jgi:hypothetical protein